MKKIIAFILGCTCLLSSAPVSASSFNEHTLHAEVPEHLIGIKNLFKTKYAPADWKKEHAGWDIDSAIEIANSKIATNPEASLKDYHEILADLFNSPKDYHVGIFFHSTESARLPFRVRGAEGRYFVVWIDPAVSNDFPLHIGDEVLAFDGLPIAEAVESLIHLDDRTSINETDIEQSAIFLTLRSGVVGHRVPQGDVDICVKPKGSNNSRTHTLTWNYQQEFITEHPQAPMALKAKKLSQPPKNVYQAIRHFRSNTNMSSPMASALQPALVKADGAFPIGDISGPLPSLGPVVWENKQSNAFRAYIFKSTAGKHIGYIRIPHFHGMHEDANEEPDLEDLRLLMRMFQRKTDALVIDLIDNTGGYLHILQAYLTMFASKPLEFLKQRIAITQSDVHESLTYIAEINNFLQLSSNPVEMAYLYAIRDYFSFIYSEWSAGRTLTEPVHIFGQDVIVPDAVSYKKPILLLTNGLDFSCADIFPAVLQDNHRVTIFGSKTAGAGGAINTHEYPNRLGIAFYTFTATLVERLNSRPLEDLGVTPDIPYNVTADDIQNGYKGYIKAVNAALKTLK